MPGGGPQTETNCHHAGSPTTQCRIPACSADRRIEASTSFASSVIDHAQIGQFWARSSDLAAWFAAASDQLFCRTFA